MKVDDAVLERIAEDYYYTALEEDHWSGLAELTTVRDWLKVNKPEIDLNPEETEAITEHTFEYVKKGFIRGFMYAMELSDDSETDTE